MLHNKKVLFFGLLLLALIAYFFVYKYTGLAIQCPIHFVTGLYCPGCGLTRMLFAIIKLDFYQAFRFNPLVFILLVIYIIYFIIKYIFKANIKIPNRVSYSLIVVLIIYGIIRNIPLFSYLQPTIIH
jgi:hypothetical protein